MNLSDNIKIALRALTANKMRSILTMLGVIIGVGAVVALMAIGNGASATITGSIEGIGSNLVTIMPGKLMSAASGGTSQQSFLYYEDYEALLASDQNIATIAPSFQTNKQVKFGDESSSVSVIGVTPEYASVRSYAVQTGRFITNADNSTSARVAVLGSQTASDLFGSVNPIGREIKIGGVNFQVVGVLESKGSSGFGSSDDMVMIPLETGYEKLFGANSTNGGKRLVNSISISAASADDVDALMNQVKWVLRKQHDLGLDETADFTVMSQADIMSAMSTVTSTLTTFLSAIAAISLLVGGIGIMNIMLVSVTERTREIGLRKAVGARRSHILMQFLVETLVLSLLGGLLGIALGAGIGAIVTATGVLEAQVTLNSVLLSFFFAVAVGLFFGIYPAVRASNLRPMEALRYE